jgi:hypothetical protein
MGSSSRVVPFTVVPSLGQTLRALSVVCMGAALFQPVPAVAGPDGPGTPKPAANAPVPAPAATLAAAAAAAAEEAQAPAAAADPFLDFFRKTEISGIVDTYYTYNFNEPATGTFTPLRSFDVKHNQFSVSLLELALNKAATTDDRIGFRFDLQYGQTAQVFNTDPLDNNNLVNVQQAYLSYLAPVGKGLTFEVGKWVTPIGSEPTEAHLNNNYSRGLVYQFGPFYHVGARVSYPVHEKVTLAGLVVNGWNATGDNNSGKTVGGGITVVPTSKVTFIQNFLFGPEQTDNADDWRTYSDTNLAFTATDKITTGLNYVYAADEVAGESINWQILALYLKGQITPVFALSPRFEWFSDPDGYVFGGGEQAIKEFTLTAEIKHPRGLITRFEYRRDWSDIDYFTKDGDPTDNQNTFTVGFIVPFSSKAP